jgi:hypothetical protein
MHVAHVRHGAVWLLVWLLPRRQRSSPATKLASTWDNLVGATGFEPVAPRLDATQPSRDVAWRRLKSQLAGLFVVWRHPASPGFYLRWLPVWIPTISFVSLIDGGSLLENICKCLALLSRQARHVGVPRHQCVRVRPWAGHRDSMPKGLSRPITSV